MTDPANVTANDDSASEVSSERREFERNFDTPATTPAAPMLTSELQFQWPDLFVAIFALCAWFILFSGGSLISTQEYRDYIGSSPHLNSAATAAAGAATTAANGETANKAFELGKAVKAWYVVILFWFVTNIGLLACVSALLGAVGRRVGFTAVQSEDEALRHVAEKQVWLYYGCSIMRGFGVYSLFLGGLFVIGGQKAAFPTDPASYLQAASLLSIVGFYAGYDPVLFSGLLARAKKFMNALPG